MALVSTKGMYGLSALYEIYLSNSLKPIQSRDIAQKANIPQTYLEQILLILKKEKFVKSTRGVHGGYMLNIDANSIKIKDVFLALEKNLNIVEAKTGNSVLDKFYDEYTKQLHQLLDLSLSELHHKYKQKRTISYTTFGL
jgi:Rrf2 family protein